MATTTPAVAKVNPTYATVPSDLQSIFDNNPYLSQAQKNDMLSVWTANPQTGNEPTSTTTTTYTQEPNSAGHGSHQVAHTTTTPVLAPQGYSDVSLQSGINDLFNPSVSSGISQIFSNTANQALQTANTKENQQLITPAPVSGYSTATMNATGRNFTPKSVTQYENKMAQANQTTQQDWNSATQAIQQLNNPATQQAYVTQAMAGALEDTMTEMGTRYGYDSTQDMQNLTTLIQNNNQFTNEMTTMFQNSLGLQYNIPDEVMSELTKEAQNG